MVQTEVALGLIAVTLLSLLVLYFATIKYVSEVLQAEGHDGEGNTNNGGPAA